MDRPDSAGAQLSRADETIQISRADGSFVFARLVYLGNDHCGFRCEQTFSPGEEVSIHLFRMGNIRARVASAEGGLMIASLSKECPV